MKGEHIFIYGKHIKEMARQANRAQSIPQLETLCEKLNIAEEIYLGQADLWLAKSALGTVYKTLRDYPHLRKFLQYFGTLEGFKTHKNQLINSAAAGFTAVMLMKDAAEQVISGCENMFNNSNGYAAAYCLGAADTMSAGIILNDNAIDKKNVLLNLAYGESTGHSPIGCRSIKSVIDHEIGHLFDFLLGISRSRAFDKFIGGYSVPEIGKNLSQYSVMNGHKNMQEIVAEAYAEYCNNPAPREIAKFVGELIDRKYMEKFYD